MKNVIDIPEQWEGCTNRHLRKCISEGTPLTEVFEVIKVEILDLDYLVDNAKYSDSETRCHNVDYLVSEILKIIDNHISEEGSDKE